MPRRRNWGHCVDLDLGFTPATNLLALRRLHLATGESADAPAAWIDLDNGALSELPQRYERRGDADYWYTAQRFDYQAMLNVTPEGFVTPYPTLWQPGENCEWFPATRSRLRRWSAAISRANASLLASAGNVVAPRSHARSVSLRRTRLISALRRCTTAAGVPAGAKTPNSESGWPREAQLGQRGHLRHASIREGAPTASARSRPP